VKVSFVEGVKVEEGVEGGGVFSFQPIIHLLLLNIFPMASLAIRNQKLKEMAAAKAEGLPMKKQSALATAGVLTVKPGSIAIPAQLQDEFKSYQFSKSIFASLGNLADYVAPQGEEVELSDPDRKGQKVPLYNVLPDRSGIAYNVVIRKVPHPTLKTKSGGSINMNEYWLLDEKLVLHCGERLMILVGQLNLPKMGSLVLVSNFVPVFDPKPNESFRIFYNATSLEPGNFAVENSYPMAPRSRSFYPYEKQLIPQILGDTPTSAPKPSLHTKLDVILGAAPSAEVKTEQTVENPHPHDIPNAVPLAVTGSASKHNYDEDGPVIRLSLNRFSPFDDDNVPAVLPDEDYQLEGKAAGGMQVVVKNLSDEYVIDGDVIDLNKPDIAKRPKFKAFFSVAITQVADLDKPEEMKQHSIIGQMLYPEQFKTGPTPIAPISSLVLRPLGKTRPPVPFYLFFSPNVAESRRAPENNNPMLRSAFPDGLVKGTVKDVIFRLTEYVPRYGIPVSLAMINKRFPGGNVNKGKLLGDGKFDDWFKDAYVSKKEKSRDVMDPYMEPKDNAEGLLALDTLPETLPDDLSAYTFYAIPLYDPKAEEGKPLYVMDEAEAAKYPGSDAKYLPRHCSLRTAAEGDAWIVKELAERSKTKAQTPEEFFATETTLSNTWIKEQRMFKGKHVANIPFFAFFAVVPQEEIPLVVQPSRLAPKPKQPVAQAEAPVAIPVAHPDALAAERLVALMSNEGSYEREIVNLQGGTKRARDEDEGVKDEDEPAEKKARLEDKKDEDYKPDDDVDFS
jgi:hypothetical protein